MADLLRGQQGTLLDIGARNRVLSHFLEPREIVYFSADLAEGHDYRLNLEEKLLLADQSFDYIVALDVLEHVEQIHQAFYELARITRKQLIIALPNVAVLSKRWSFLRRGNFGTQKYDLLLGHQGDRHRWLTVYHEINTFVAANAARAGLSLELIVEELEGGRFLGRLASFLNSVCIVRNGLLTSRCIYLLNRR